MMNDWNSQREALLGRVGEYAKLSPDVVRGVGMMDAAAAKTGKLEPKIRGYTRSAYLCSKVLSHFGIQFNLTLMSIQGLISPFRARVRHRQANYHPSKMT